MDYISVTEFAKRLGVAERTVRNNCVQGKIDGAVLVGKTWSLPVDARLPERRACGLTAPLHVYDIVYTFILSGL